jgi:hypothetical protein
MGRACNTKGEEECMKVGKSKEEKPLGRPRRRWMVSIKMDLGETGWVSVVNTVMNIRVPLNAGKVLE